MACPHDDGGWVVTVNHAAVKICISVSIMSLFVLGIHIREKLLGYIIILFGHVKNCQITSQSESTILHPYQLRVQG